MFNAPYKNELIIIIITLSIAMHRAPWSSETSELFETVNKFKMC